MVDFYTDKDEDVLTVHIDDTGGEGFVTNVTIKKGWDTYLIPLRYFRKYTSYQPPEAVQTNNFDLDAVTTFRINPAVGGTSGKFLLDNVKLTNSRE